MTPKPAGNPDPVAPRGASTGGPAGPKGRTREDPLEKAGRAHSRLNAWGDDGRAPIETALDGPRLSRGEPGGGERSGGTWQMGDPGPVLERELLLVNAEKELPASPRWRRLRTLGLTLLVAAAGAALLAGGLYGFHQLDSAWQQRIEALVDRVATLEAASQRQSDELAASSAGFSSAVARLESRDEELKAALAEARAASGRTAAAVARLREETTRLAAACEELETNAGERLEAVLSRFYPWWLSGGSAGERAPEGDSTEAPRAEGG